MYGNKSTALACSLLRTTKFHRKDGSCKFAVTEQQHFIFTTARNEYVIL